MVAYNNNLAIKTLDQLVHLDIFPLHLDGVLKVGKQALLVVADLHLLHIQVIFKVDGHIAEHPSRCFLQSEVVFCAEVFVLLISSLLFISAKNSFEY